MRRRATFFAAVALLLAAACGGGDDGDTVTMVAVRNGGTASIDATVSDGDTELTFENVAADTTSSAQTASFGSLSALTVKVGNATSDADLTAGALNVIAIGNDGKVSSVLAATPPKSSGGGDGW